MADKKISELTNITGANVSDANDTIAIVDSSAGQTKKITRGELFKDVDGADFTGDVTLGASQNYVGNSSSSTLNFLRDNGPSFLDSNNQGTTLFRFRDDSEASVAQVDAAGTAANSASTVITREKGDARYAELSGADFTGDIRFTASNSGNSSIRWALSDYSEGVRLVPFGPRGTLNVVADIGGANEKRYTFDSDGNEGGLTVLRHGDIERGSNANGEYVRFPDGTQICTTVGGITGAAPNLSHGGIYRSSLVTWTFPASFVANPVVAGQVQQDSDWIGLQSPSNTSVSMRVLSGTTDATVRNLRVCAIGRWK